MEAKSYSGRLADLEEHFAELEPKIPETAEKQALSILHGMVQELARNLRNSDGVHAANALALRDIADLLRHGPPMEGAAQSVPLPVGSEAPDFALADGDARTVALHDFRGKTVMLVFYPLDWSPTCSDQLSLYEGEKEELAKHGVQIVGISVDSLYSHRAWAAIRGITFPLLADFEPKGDVARRYSVWRPQDGYSERALYVIDKDQLIQYGYVSPKLNHVPDIFELYRVLEHLGEPATTAAGAASG